jgi:hypothetical protein
MASATLPRNGHSDPFDHVIGIDTHRDFHVAVVLAPNGGKLGELTFPTSSEGYKQLVIWSEQFGIRPEFAMEGTGDDPPAESGQGFGHRWAHQGAESGALTSGHRSGCVA